jgi:hypothetical protein
MDNDTSLDNETSLDNDTSLDETSMNKQELIKSIDCMSKLTRRALSGDPKIAQDYYEKVHNLYAILRMMTDFEHSLVADLDVD